MRFPLLTVLLLICGAACGAAPKVVGTFDEHGLATLSCDGVPLLKGSALRVNGVMFAGDKGADVPADRDNPTISFEPAARRLSYSWPWGAVRCRYEMAGTRLNLELTIENDTAGPLSEIGLDLLELQFPRRPSGSAFEKRFEIISDAEDAVTAQIADYQTGVLTFCNDEPKDHIRAGFAAGAQPPQETWLLRVYSPEYAGQPQIFVAPRSAKVFHLSVRFSEPGVPLKEIAGDIFAKFAEAHPFQLKWPDRRPIGMLMLAGSDHSSPTNPRGWFNEAKDNFLGPAGVKRFREKVLAAADRSIAILKSMGAQGVIFWNMEGDQYPSISFVGDPRMTAQLAPEMDAVAPELFARFHQAGLRTGVCIRPSRIVPGWDGKSKWQHSQMGFDVVEEMNQKILYARKRLGCLLFYVDTDVRYFFKRDGTVSSCLLEGAAFKHLADLHPDVLLIPELSRLGFWSCTAPYHELRPTGFGSHAASDDRVLACYPRAFSVINPTDGPAQQYRAELVAGQRRGDIMLFRCWYPDEQNKVFKSILDEANRK